MPPERVWAEVERLGGKQGYGYGDRLWQLRGWIDRLVGGVGMRRGRRHPVALRVGDAIDFWRVVALDPGRRLTLRAEMRLPGSAVLEFEVAARPGGSQLTTSAHFHPAGVGGLVYWYAMKPFHDQIFREMPRRLVARAAQPRAGDPEPRQRQHL